MFDDRQRLGFAFLLYLVACGLLGIAAVGLFFHIWPNTILVLDDGRGRIWLPFEFVALILMFASYLLADFKVPRW